MATPGGDSSNGEKSRASVAKPPDLAELRPPRVYETGQADLIAEFYQPCLSRSIEYCRAVGFFSSSLLPLLAESLKTFVLNEGRMRLVINPRLAAEDAEAIERGYHDRATLETAIGSAVTKNLEELYQSPEFGVAIRNLAWLIAHGVLDVKVAVPFENGQVLRGIYHEKLGFFRDRAGNILAFQGSANEGEQAVWANFESVWVYTTWPGLAQNDYFRDVVRMFESRWNNSTPGLLVTDFPKTPKEWLRARTPDSLGFSGPAPAPSEEQSLSLRPYQHEAVAAWIRAGRRGILEMATGTGKTRVALQAIKSELMSGRSVLVAVPSRALLTQWEREARRYLPTARLVTLSGRGKWTEAGVVSELLAGKPPTLAIGVTKTLATEAFLGRARSALNRGNFTLVVDEVHHVGSETRSKLLDLPCDYRLGLSATPQRPFDPDGTEAIRSYFGGVVFTFDIGDAIQAGVLAPYDYQLHEVRLSRKETEEYLKLARRITSLGGVLARMLSLSAGQSLIEILKEASRQGLQAEVTTLTALIQQRADIAKKARAKVDLAVRVMTASPSLKRVLVYCDDHEQLQEVERALTAAGVQTVRYVGEMDEASRARALKAIDGGTARAVMSMKCLDEGVDIPSCDGALVLASSKTWREFVQRRGRVLRLYSGKTHSTIVDPVVVPDQSIMPPQRDPGLVLAELRRCMVFIRDAANRPIAESNARRIALKYGVSFTEVEGAYGTAV